MTDDVLLDHFAGLALQALVLADEVAHILREATIESQMGRETGLASVSGDGVGGGLSVRKSEDTALRAYDYADAMLKARLARQARRKG